jgi:flagellar protein FliS
LKVDVWEGGPRLAALYDWLLTELMQANIKRDANRVSSCRQVVEPLRDAWRQAAASLATSPS